MFRSIALAGLAGGLWVLSAFPADARGFGRHHARGGASAGCCQPTYSAAPTSYAVSHHSGHYGHAVSGSGCCGASGTSGYASYSPGYPSGVNYYPGINYGVRTTNPYAYDPIRRRAGGGYGSYYGSPDYGYRSYYGTGGFRSPSYRRGGMIIPPSGRGGYGTTFYRSGGFGNPYYGRGGYGFGRGIGYGTGYGFGPGISIGLGGW